VVPNNAAIKRRISVG